MRPVWVIDDDRSIRWVFEKALAREGIPFKTFAQANEAIEALTVAGAPQVLVSDIRMPGTSGLELLQNLKQRYPDLPIIVMTAYSDLESAVAAFQGGAFEYLPKPFDVDQAVDLIRRALGESMRDDEVEESSTGSQDILGQAQSMQEVFRAVGRLSQSNATVLITGESGTGKELVARALHRHSPRADKPFVAINTAAMPRDLLESELFGHERGAFTGAQALRRGRFEQAEGGTLFLDEIGDMPAELQTRLLRVLSDGNFYRVGGHQPIRAGVRVNVIRLRLPSLSERREDIPLLARHFLAKSARELGVEPKRLSDAAMTYLSAQVLPGNVRQLENVCHWLTVMSPTQVIEVGDFPPELREDTASPSAEWLAALARETDRRLANGETNIMEALSRSFEKTLIAKALAHTGGRRIEAAGLLGIGRNTITRKIGELGIEGGTEADAE